MGKCLRRPEQPVRQAGGLQRSKRSPGKALSSALVSCYCEHAIISSGIAEHRIPPESDGFLCELPGKGDEHGLRGCFQGNTVSGVLRYKA